MYMREERGERKTPWRCGNDHILGMVIVSGRGVNRLLLYRNAVNMSAEMPEEVEVMGVLHGMMMDIKCDVPGCGCVRTWSEDARAKRKGTYVAE